MDVPVLTAIIGVSGTLLGTIVGGYLPNFLLQKRRERAEVRIGCRLIDGELRENESLISYAVLSKHWWSSEREPALKAWEDHQHVLAAYLPYEAWSDVRSAIRGVHTTRLLSVSVRSAKIETIGDTQVELLAACVEDLQKAQASLQPYLREPRLLKPLRIGPRIP
jgi:hypothetical protein